MRVELAEIAGGVLEQGAECERLRLDRRREISQVETMRS
jgi:hypothetical protein